jgi:hypothetical protein
VHQARVHAQLYVEKNLGSGAHVLQGSVHQLRQPTQVDLHIAKHVITNGKAIIDSKW